MRVSWVAPLPATPRTGRLALAGSPGCRHASLTLSLHCTLLRHSRCSLAAARGHVTSTDTSEAGGRYCETLQKVVLYKVTSRTVRRVRDVVTPVLDVSVRRGGAGSLADRRRRPPRAAALRAHTHTACCAARARCWQIAPAYWSHYIHDVRGHSHHYSDARSLFWHKPHKTKIYEKLFVNKS